MSKGRKVLYFIGAGASRASGAFVQVQGGGHLLIPTQAEFWPVFLRLSHRAANRNAIESFLFRYFVGYGRTPTRAAPKDRRAQLAKVDVEEVFTFLSERTKAPSSTPQLKAYSQKVWDALLEELGAVFSRFKPNAQTRTLVSRFHKKHVRAFDCIVSFNYDTVFEESLPRKVTWGYSGIESLDGRLPILKPHGSINWTLENGHVVRASAPDRPVVVAPTHLKFVETTVGTGASGYLDQAPEVRTVWENMEREMKNAQLLVFIGYSFPVADLYFSSVLRSVLADRASAPNVVLVNPDAVSIASRLKARFSLPYVVKYFDFGQFIEAGRNGVQRAVEAEQAA